jgi:hypothetical protein
MRTLIFQSLGTLVSLLFGVVALRIGRYPVPYASARRQAWLVVGFAFVMFSLNKGLQECFAVAAFLSGEGAPIYDFFISWSPAFNQSRTIAGIALWLVLGLFVVTGQAFRRRDLAVAMAAILAGMAIGAGIGIYESGLEGVRHFSAVAILDSAELAVLLSVLFGLLVRDRLDRLLWLALAIHAIKLAVNTIWMAALINWSVPGSWSPPIWYMHAGRAVLTGVMLGLAWWRLILAKRGVEIPALFETDRVRSSVAIR